MRPHYRHLRKVRGNSSARTNVLALVLCPTLFNSLYYYCILTLTAEKAPPEEYNHIYSLAPLKIEFKRHNDDS